MRVACSQEKAEFLLTAPTSWVVKGTAGRAGREIGKAWNCRIMKVKWDVPVQDNIRKAGTASGLDLRCMQTQLQRKPK